MDNLRAQRKNRKENDASDGTVERRYRETSRQRSMSPREVLGKVELVWERPVKLMEVFDSQHDTGPVFRIFRYIVTPSLFALYTTDLQFRARSSHLTKSTASFVVHT